MATIQDEIIDDFLTRLSESSSVDAALVEALRDLFKSGNMVKPEDLVTRYGAAKKEGGA